MPPPTFSRETRMGKGTVGRRGSFMVPSTAGMQDPEKGVQVRCLGASRKTQPVRMAAVLGASVKWLSLQEVAPKADLL